MPSKSNLAAPSVNKGSGDYFYQRYDRGHLVKPEMPRLTTQESEKGFSPRDEGLRILLINAPIREWSYPNIMPLGQGYVGSVAIMDGHKLDVLDLNAERKNPVSMTGEEMMRWIEGRISDMLSSAMPDVIGLGGIITQYGRIKGIAQVCKKLAPNLPIILGGGIASSAPEFMLRRTSVDIVVREEGEVTISELLKRLEKKEPLNGLPGVGFKDVSGEAHINELRPSIAAKADGLDGLPWPAREHWPLEDVYKINPVGHLNWENKWSDGKANKKGAFSLSLTASRGCPYAVKACDYCYASYLGKKYRLRSPDEVASEMQYLQEHYGVSYLHFLDDLLMTDHRWALEFFEALKRRRDKYGLDVMWGGTCRTNIIANDIIRSKKEGRPNILELGYEVGMRQAAYGVETGSPTILKSIDKSGQTPEKIILAIEETQRVFGYADCSFMLGSPGESKQTIRETIDLCKSVGLKPEVFFFTTAYPATTFWQLALDKGLITKAVTGTKGEADEDMIEQYFLKLGEQGEDIRTNFSDIPDQELAELSWQAVQELGAQNIRHPGSADSDTVQVTHPHTGEVETKDLRTLQGASKADI